MIEKFADKCVWSVARELARPKATGMTDWLEQTKANVENAKKTIDAMTNLELLKLIEQVFDETL